WSRALRAPRSIIHFSIGNALHSSAEESAKSPRPGIGFQRLQRSSGSARAYRSQRSKCRLPFSVAARSRAERQWPIATFPFAGRPGLPADSPGVDPRPLMQSPLLSHKATQFSESVIRGMSIEAAKHGAVNLAQGMPDFPAPAEIKAAA